VSAGTGEPPDEAAAEASPPADEAEHTGAALSTRQLSKLYDDGTVALDDVNLDVAPGEFMVVLGPTGCGKTTLLRVIAGLERATAGHVFIDGRPVDNDTARERRVAMVFQEFALYPHLTAAANIGFPLRVSHAPDTARRVARVAALLGISDVVDRRPQHLSGGQRQRVAIGRAIIREPKVFLLDEPLSNVDAAMRAELRAEVAALARRLRVTTLYVTHDQTEAMTLADRVTVLRRGRVQQVGSPDEVYSNPATVFVAGFLGTPRPNLVQAAIHAAGGRVEIDLGGQVIHVAASDPRARALATLHGQRVTVALRADALTPVADDAEGAVVRGTARFVENLGHESLVHLDAGVVGTAAAMSLLEQPQQRLRESVAGEPPVGGGGTLRHAVTRLIPRHQPAPPEPTARTEYGFYPVYEEGVAATAASGDLVVRVPAPARPRTGESLTFAVDLDRMLLFDHDGARIRVG